MWLFVAVEDLISSCAPVQRTPGACMRSPSVWIFTAVTHQPDQPLKCRHQQLTVIVPIRPIAVTCVFSILAILGRGHAIRS